MEATVFYILLTSLPLSLSLPIGETEPSYMPGPDGRGTIELLWSCLLTFGLCVWTVFHPNVIPWTKFWNQIYYRMGGMLGTIVFPELLVFFALGQYLQAKKVLKSWEKQFEGSIEKEWLGKQGAFFVVMGGFEVEFQVPAQSTTCESKESRTDAQVSSDPAINEKRDLVNELRDRRKFVTTIRPDGFCKLLEEQWFRNLIKSQKLSKDYFCERNIADKGNADNIAKFLVSVQILWMCIQCLGRELSGLPITLLEGHILIQILYSVVAYSLWWDKPLDIAEPISLPLPSDKICSLIQPRTEFNPRPFFITEHTSCNSPTQMFARVAYDVANYNTHPLEACAMLMALLNGGLHAIAWDSHFPTATEQLLWRISCVGTGALLPMIFSVMWKNGSEPYIVRALLNMTVQNEDSGFGTFLAEMWRAAKDMHEGRLICGEEDDNSSRPVWPVWLPKWARIFVPILFFTLLLGYLFCILYLTVESFLSMRSLPKGAYSTVEWSDFIPHV
ncbi:hypothetical protein BDV59DRAFT_19722 [Aspergillus ambiguus]|uniref:uncharacterized protein n=1 Tax=Aspergillus ambiguus TaxID=176160 RepID=UPI003CCD281A